MTRRLALLLAVWCGAACTSPRERLERRIDRIVAGLDARVGVALRLSDGRSCTLAVLVTDSREEDAVNARAIARIARAVVGEVQ